MGLGVVELIIDIEQRFGIEIPDPVANRLRTPRQLIDHVCALVGASEDGECVSQHAFYVARGAHASAVAETIRQLIRAHSGIQSFSDDDDLVRDLDMG